MKMVTFARYAYGMGTIKFWLARSSLPAIFYNYPLSLLSK